MKPFVYQTLPGRVLFGVGRLAEVSDELEALGAERALILCTPGRTGLAERIAGLLGERCAGIHNQALTQVPYTTVAAAVERVRDRGIDLLIAAGGGSTIGLAKGIALETALPILAVPTTYAGSEMTPIWGLTRDGRKTTGRDPRVKPRTVIYDPDLTLTLSAPASATSGMNAVAHSVEALYAQHASPIVSLMAEASIRALGASLPRVVAAPDDLEARSDALVGAWLAGTALGMVGMALHHKLCHVLGGSFSLPHAATHAVVLPHAAAFNASHAPEAMRAIGRALGRTPEDAAGTLYDLVATLGAPTSLAALGLSETRLDEVAYLAVEHPYVNPRPVTREGVRRLLDDAFHGRRPEPAQA